jgi:hypothetical protein
VDVCALGGGQFKVWTGDGAGNWTEAAAVTVAPSGSYTAFRAGGDFDHNGRPDLALILRESSRNMAYAYKETSPAESLNVFPVFPRGREKFSAGSAQFVDWWSAASNPATTRVRLELSTQGPSGPWQLIADSLRNAGRYQWRLPTGINSTDCCIRYTVYGPGGSVSAITPRAFTIAGLTAVLEPSTPPLRDRASSFKLYPNPASGWLVVDVTGENGSQLTANSSQPEIRLFDANGCRVARMHVGANEVSRLAPGVYFVKRETGDRPQRVVIAK